MTDPIADFLTRIRNAVRVGHKVVNIPGSKMKLEMTRILKEKGYILNYKYEQDGAKSNIKIALKYHPETKESAIKSLVRVSKPGLRRYTSVEDMPRVLNGLGIAILSTSLGLMTDKEARQRNVGGEVLCYVY
ncbi:MAG TPA: 30S ribosomal protein S8 [Candidatus Odoribacter faecigallinarum]|jgi:small subunit ribosomal protein S8|uniref:Small ribosomal subunit protein uS8 n=1 Tax=Candidatus Odoribacter faecigallinarum TaxID=2838706 RepID=A0A9D1UZX4_9BACT|nr:30S ribosomal protein S8 [Candidatus Odoribacter faecigallinarum]